MLQSETKNTHLLYGSPEIQALEFNAKGMKKFLYEAGEKINFLNSEHHFEILQQQYPNALQRKTSAPVRIPGNELVASITPSFVLNGIVENKNNMTEIAFITLCNALRKLA